MADDDRTFVITVRRTWTLWILPTIATLYFLGILLLNVLDYEIQGLSMDLLVLVGVALFVLVILIELPYFLRRRPKREAPPPPVTPTAAAQPSVTRNGWDDELMITPENQQGLQVVEYSAPAKSRNSNAVYTKTYVPVTGAHVLRVETLVANQTEI